MAHLTFCISLAPPQKSFLLESRAPRTPTVRMNAGNHTLMVGRQNLAENLAELVQLLFR
jgi:hypothetical protein